ncbi:MAG: hypothetical protein P8J68_01420 [Arenicellaceae bacterium]|nr:hypothetical protein [Arenicellaceae bacterium]
MKLNLKLECRFRLIQDHRIGMACIHAETVRETPWAYGSTNSQKECIRWNHFWMLKLRNSMRTVLIAIFCIEPFSNYDSDRVRLDYPTNHYGDYGTNIIKTMFYT